MSVTPPSGRDSDEEYSDPMIDREEDLEEDELEEEEEGGEDEEDEEGRDEEEPAEAAAAERTPEETARTVNEANFKSAAMSLKESEPTWAMQLEMVLGRPVALHLDFDSLQGRFELVQPFIHQALAATLEAITRLAFDPAGKPLAGKIKEVIIRGTGGGRGCVAELNAGILSVLVPLVMADIRPPTGLVFDALQVLGGSAPAAQSAIVPAGRENSAEAFKPAVFSGDPYEAAARFIISLEALMRQNNLWPGDKPKGEIEVQGAFGSENMTFQQWLAWVFIPRIGDIVATRDSFPNGSEVAAYAVREFDGIPGISELIELLAGFDDMINQIAGK